MTDEDRTLVEELKETAALYADDNWFSVLLMKAVAAIEAKHG